MAEKGKVEKLVLRTIEWLSVVASLGFVFGYFFFSRYLSMTVALTYLLIVYSSLLPLCLDQLRKPSKKSKKLIAWSILVMFYGIIPCWIFIGGIDCELPDDSDLLLPQSGEPYTDEENGWTILSNVLSQVEKISNSWMYDGTNTDQRADAWDLANGKLCFYVNPEEEYCWIDLDETMPDILSHFTNRTTSVAYVESLLKSNEWLLAGINAALAAPRYIPPPISPMASPYDYQPRIPITEILQVNRSFLLSRVKCKIDLVGVNMLKENVSFLERELDGCVIPAEKLKAFDNLLKGISGLSSEVFAHALKMEYVSIKEFFKFKPVDIVFVCSRDPDFAKLLLTPIARYACHPNRCLCVVAEHIRNVIQSEVLPCEEGNHWRRKLGWIGVLIPNYFEGVGMVSYGSYRESVRMVSENVAAVRHKIAERISVAQTNGTITASSQYFPLVFTNGCYYTHDMKKIIMVGCGTNAVESTVMPKQGGEQ